MSATKIDKELYSYHLHSCHSNQAWVEGMEEPFPCDCGLIDLFNKRQHQLLDELMDKLKVEEKDGWTVARAIALIEALKEGIK